MIGKRVYFGEVLGKYSEIEGTVEAGDVVMLTNDQTFIDRAKEYGVIPTGFNPFDYVNGE